MDDLGRLRFFLCPGIPAAGERLRLPPDEERHLFVVLRARPGESAGLMDGRGRVAAARVREGRLLEVERVETRRRPARSVILYAAAPRRNQMDALVRQAVEAGADAIVPLATRRSVACPSGEAAAARWRREAIEACKQCRNPFAPEVRQPVGLSAALAHARDACDAIFLCAPSAPPSGAPSLPAVVKGGLGMFIGPEGGFDPEEEDALAAAGARPLRLARFVLRVETAAAVAAAYLSRLVLEEERM